jgi:hypothetical protein
LISGKLMCRLGRLGDGGARWISCHAIVVPGKLFLLVGAPPTVSPATSDGVDGDAFARLPPAPAVATGGRATPLIVRDAISLANARVIARGPRWSDGGGGEFDVVAEPGRRGVLALFRPRNNRAGGAEPASVESRARRDAWIRALERAAAACEEYDAFSADGGGAARRRGGDENGFFFPPGRSRAALGGEKPPWWRGRQGPSAALDATTRAALSEVTRHAVALDRDLGLAIERAEGSEPMARSPLKRAAAVTPRARPGGERVLVLDRYWKDVELGVSAHFLFSFSVAAFSAGGRAPRSCTSTPSAARSSVTSRGGPTRKEAATRDARG